MQQSPTPKGPHRVEHDSMGEVSVPKSEYWGAQTQRCLNHFHIRHDPMPSEVILAYAAIKKACAMVILKNFIINISSTKTRFQD